MRENIVRRNHLNDSVYYDRRLFCHLGKSRVLNNHNIVNKAIIFNSTVYDKGIGNVSLARATYSRYCTNFKIMYRKILAYGIQVLEQVKTKFREKYKYVVVLGKSRMSTLPHSR